MTLDLLAIGAHRDDVELTCAGTLLVAADRGQRVGVLDLTAGEMGTRGSAVLRQSEAEAAAQVLGLTMRENLGLPDAGIENTRATREALVRVLRQWRPTVVIAPAPVGRHPDHRLAAELVRDACFLSGLAKYGDGGPAHRPRKLVHAISYREDFDKPSFVVDVSAVFERKLAAIRCYASQFDGTTQAGEVYPNGEPLVDIVTHHAAHYGSLIRRRYGEPFWTRETLRVDDLLTLDVSTF
ncbi:MAG: bacillithiol biosynthesis deacetylase BshB1 [Gemmatimonadaceae bacterium]|nr:bacillithiol biosynthesis deacetylase BshB1 [Gemmatimonadaceae bacterium]